MANKNFYRHNKTPQKLPTEVQGDRAALELSVDGLGLTQPTLELLKANNFVTLYDLARRTEREMFKIQTFSKKHLMDIKPKLNAKGLNFYPMEEKPRTQPAEQNGQPRQAEQKAAGNGRNSRTPQPNVSYREDGRRDNRDRWDGRDKAPLRKERPAPPPKNVLLPLDEWRKVNKNGKWGFNNGLTTVIEPQYDEVFLFKEELACVELDEKCGYINSAGEMVIPIEYECAMSFSEGLASVVIKGLCGYIDKQNQLVIPAKYSAATPFEEGRAKVKADGKWITIDTEGNVLWSK